jgi:hypothetical protein
LIWPLVEYMPVATRKRRAESLEAAIYRAAAWITGTSRFTQNTKRVISAISAIFVVNKMTLWILATFIGGGFGWNPARQ